MRNIPCQPNRGMIQMPESAAMVPPIGTPDIIRVAIMARSRGGTTPATSALADGTRPPRPIPARNRNAANTGALGANAHKMVKTEKTAAQPSTAFFRPTPSEIRPARIAPTSIPANATLPTVPAVALVRPQPVSLIRVVCTVP